MANLARKWDACRRLMRLDRPIGTWLVLWPALWALWIATDGHPDGAIVVIFACGALLMRSAGCVVNDIADRNIDPHVARTRNRPLAAGELSLTEAALLFALLLLLAGGLALLLNRLTIALAVVAALLAALYPFTKRWLPVPQFFLALAFAMAIPMAFAATRGSVPWIAWWLVAADMLWVIAYDTIYALIDREDDLKIGVRSTAILFEKRDRLIIGLLQAACLALLTLLGRHLDLGWPWFAGLSGAAMLFGYQQWLIRGYDRDACMTAFLNNHTVGALLFAALFFSYL